MKKITWVFLAVMLVGFVASCKAVDFANGEENSTHPKIAYIELAYYNHLAEPVKITDAEMIETICAYIEQAGGERAESSKGIYGIPYMLTLYYREEEPLVFYLWSESKYSTSQDTDEEGFSYFYLDDISVLYWYIKDKYPFEAPTLG